MKQITYKCVHLYVSLFSINKFVCKIFVNLDAMKIKEVAETIEAKVLCGEDKLDMELEFAFASDLMSDVLTIEHDRVLLLTGLANVQAIRTAEMSDINCVVIVRSKKVTDEMVELAKEGGIVLIQCEKSMFKASGLLFQKGLKPIF